MTFGTVANAKSFFHARETLLLTLTSFTTFTLQFLYFIRTSLDFRQRVTVNFHAKKVLVRCKGLFSHFLVDRCRPLLSDEPVRLALGVALEVLGRDGLVDRVALVVVAANLRRREQRRTPEEVGMDRRRRNRRDGEGWGREGGERG